MPSHCFFIDSLRSFADARFKHEIEGETTTEQFPNIGREISLSSSLIFVRRKNRSVLVVVGGGVDSE